MYPDFVPKEPVEQFSKWSAVEPWTPDDTHWDEIQIVDTRKQELEKGK